MGNQEYVYKENGDRIRSERRAAGYKSAEKFGHDLNIGRSQIEQIERGERLPDLETLVKMAKIFNCEVGYLLCEEGYECKTKKATEIHMETGLSPIAIKNLGELRKGNGKAIAFLNELLAHPSNLCEIAERYLMYRALREIDPLISEHSSDLEGKDVDLRMEFNPTFAPRIPIEQATDYSKFELLRMFMNFVEK